MDRGQSLKGVGHQVMSGSGQKPDTALDSPRVRFTSESELTRLTGLRLRSEDGLNLLARALFHVPALLN